ncbi:MAG: DNA cytosine methyltransferase [Nitrospirae bacterium]|nr:DNA cytosine methyltransferase [Nitrospirota bacterium]
MRSVELFAGAGGLAMGISNAGFRHEAVVEWNADACNTIRGNQRNRVSAVSDWPLFQADVRKFDYSFLPEGIDLLAGGPPCQPFSLAGKHRGSTDERNMFPEAIRAVRELKPRAIMIENVKGLLRQSFAKYFEYITLQLSYPEIKLKNGEDWTSHLSRLEQYHTRGRHDGLFYRVVFRLLNAADHGVPQRRERVVIVGFRSDIQTEWSFPSPTHSQDPLIKSQWVTGEYWDRHKVAQKGRPAQPDKLASRIDRLRFLNEQPECKPWVTVRDAISGLPDVTERGRSNKLVNHVFVPGARVYTGHTGSPLDEPAKTLKAGDHGVPGGENMLAYPDGKVRYFTIRESARLQTFPDEFIFPGSWSEAMRQLGNAVPVTLGQVVAENIKACLIKSKAN